MSLTSDHGHPVRPRLTRHFGQVGITELFDSHPCKLFKLERSQISKPFF